MTLSVPKSARYWAALAFIHCVIVGMGAGGLRVQDKGPLGEIVTWYGALTGAERGFGFFAPEVSTQGSSRFIITDHAGKSTQVDLSTSSVNEAALRVNNLGSRFWKIIDQGDASLRRALAASLAGKIFADHPKTVSVEVQFQVYDLVTMAAYRQGQRPSWRQIYAVTFVRGQLESR